MDELRATRMWLKKQFGTSGIQLDEGALQSLIKKVQPMGDPEEYVHNLMEEIEAGE